MAKRRRNALRPSYYIAPVFTAVFLLALLALSTASTRLVERHYDQQATTHDSITGRVSQLNAARQGRMLTPDWLTTTLAVSSTLSLLALTTRLALGRDGLSGVLKQLKRPTRRKPAPTTTKATAPLIIPAPAQPNLDQQTALPTPPELDEDTPDAIRWT